MFEPIKRAIRDYESEHYQQTRRISELEETLSKASLFENDIRRVLASVTCPCCGALSNAEHGAKCSIGIVLRCKY
jgi:transcription elongation GreA/GreB family factor